MNLQDIASISGKPGLYRVVKPTRSGVILEILDGSGKKIIASANNRVSILKEISIYTNTTEGSVPLEKVLFAIHEKYNGDTKLTGKEDNQVLYQFLEDVVSEYDREKVYASDIKKLILWYDILVKHAADVFTKPTEEATVADTGNSSENNDSITTEAKKKAKAASVAKKTVKKEDTNASASKASAKKGAATKATASKRKG